MGILHCVFQRFYVFCAPTAALLKAHFSADLKFQLDAASMGDVMTFSVVLFWGFTVGKYSVPVHYNRDHWWLLRCQISSDVRLQPPHHPDCRISSGRRWMYGWKAKICTVASETGATFITALGSVAGQATCHRNLPHLQRLI